MAEQGVTNVLVCGIGGQGVLTAAEILALAAVEFGHDVKKTEVAGMSQRGGVVTSHVRFGRKVLSPAIPPGEADILMGFEAAEALRWCRHLRPTGVAMVNTLQIVPPVVSTGLFTYPDEPVAAIAKAGVTLFSINAGAIAAELGNPKLINTVMLGFVAEHLPFAPDALRKFVVDQFAARKPQLAEVNGQAFDRGRAALQSARKDSAA